MKNIYLLFVCVSRALLAGCTTEKDTFAKMYPELLPDEEAKYSLLAVEEKVTLERLDENEVRNVSPIKYRSSLEGINDQYPQLELEEAPVFVVFDENGVVDKTDNFEEAIEILRN